MRRLLALLAVLAAATLGAGCVGPDGEEALQLLRDADAAQQALSSASFDLSVEAGVPGQQLALQVAGASVLRGEGAGNVHVRVSGSGLPGPSSLELVARDGRAFVRLDGAWQALPGPAGQPEAADPRVAELTSSLASLQLERYVTAVSVSAGPQLADEPTRQIVGGIDTEALLDGVLARATQALGPQAGPVPDLSHAAISDTTVVLVVGERTRLVRQALVTLTIDAAGEQGTLTLRYALREPNGAVELPAIPRKVLRAAERAGTDA
ncbi:MAG: hypothetical protein R3C15_05205 [Thermoleophilia bacterium]